MARNKMSEKTKEKILQAALEEFQDKGFNKAKVDDVAKRAGLTKMMLYYHFKSKENIMSEIMKKVLSEVIDKFHENISNLDTNNPQSVRNHIEIMIDYFNERKDVMRLIISENLKSENTGSFSIFEEFFKIISSVFKEDNSKIDSQYEFMIGLFFFNTLPMVMYSGLSDKFNRDFDIDSEKSKQAFIDTFIKVLYENLNK